MWRVLVALAVFGSLCATEVRADARGPVRPLSAGALLGYGVDLAEYNVWAAGLGLRGGYNDGPWYFGARFAYHFGSEVGYDEWSVVQEDVAVNVWQLGLDAGYDIYVTRQLAIRPELGFGLAHRIGSAELALADEWSAIDATANEPYVSFGAAGNYDMTPTLYAGLDLQLNAILGHGGHVGFLFFAHVGVRFGPASRRA